MANFNTLLQALILLILIYVFITSDWLGFFLLLPSLIANLAFHRFTKKYYSVVAKYLLLLQGILCVIICWNLKIFPAEFPISKNIFPGMSAPILGRKEFIRKELYADVAIPINHQLYDDIKLSDTSIAPLIPNSSYHLIISTLGDIGQSNHPDIRHRNSSEVISSLQRIFHELPTDGFDSNYRSPCWIHSSQIRKQFGKEFNNIKENMLTTREYQLGRPFFIHNNNNNNNDQKNAYSDETLSCLPLVYILGQPKCGTTDLYQRISLHKDIQAPKRKEVSLYIY